MPIRTASRKQRSFPRTMSPFKMPWRDVELLALGLVRMADKRRKAYVSHARSHEHGRGRHADAMRGWQARVVSAHTIGERSSNDATLKNWR